MEQIIESRFKITAWPRKKEAPRSCYKLLFGTIIAKAGAQRLMMPEISIIIPCYEQARYLPDAVESIIKQTWQDWECIIVDDASPDNTNTLASGFCKADSRIRLVTTPNNLGLAAARNYGIKQARSPYILPLDADDKVSETYIANALGVFQQDPDTSLVYAKAVFFGNEEGVWQLPPYHFGLLFGRNPIYCSAIYKKADWSSSGGYDVGLKKGLEDWDFWLKILNPHSKVVQLDEIGFYYRKHSQSMIRDLALDYEEYENTKADMLIRYRKKWLDWSFHYFAPLLEQLQFQKEREQKLAANLWSRWCYKMARVIAGAS